MEKHEISKDENLILFDWLTSSIRGKEVPYVIQLLGLKQSSFLDMKHGLNGYPNGIHFGGISILFGASDEMGVCVNMSGTGCRTWESNSERDWEDLLDCLLRFDHIVNITRLDVAFDDHSGLVDLRRIREDTEDDLFLSKWKHWDIQIGSDGELTVYFGSRSSAVMLRMYDKAIERGYTDGRHWIRFELQLRDERASAFIDAMFKMSIGEVFRGTLVNYLRFLQPSSSDTNKSRWFSAQYWEDLIEGVSRIQLWSAPGIEYNAQQLEHFVIDQAGNAIRTYIKLFGYMKFTSQLKDLNKDLPTKYAKLLSEAGYDPWRV